MDGKENIPEISADKDKSGYIYILTNKSMEGLLKIGFTMRVNVEARCRELSAQTGLPTPYDVVYKKKSYFVVEDGKLIHSSLSGYHYGKEFYKVSIDEAVLVIEDVLVRSIEKKIALIERERDVIEREKDSLLKNAEMYIARGAAYAVQGDHDKAIADFTGAIEINHKAADAYYYRGLSFQLKGEYDSGIANYRKAAKLGFKPAQDILRTKGIDWREGAFDKTMSLNGVNPNIPGYFIAAKTPEVEIIPSLSEITPMDTASEYIARVRSYPKKREHDKKAKAEEQPITEEPATEESVTKKHEENESVQKTFTWPDGRKYVGEYKDNKKNGHGTYTWPNGRKYAGEFKNDKKSGQGTYTWPDGRMYVGEFRNDKMNGQGTYSWPDGKRYVGEFRDDKRNGQGTYVWPDGHKYIGEFKNDKMNGHGTYSWPDGHKYIGEFKNDKMNGHGTYSWPDGRRYVGEFKNDVLYEKRGEFHDDSPW